MNREPPDRHENCDQRYKCYKGSDFLMEYKFPRRRAVTDAYETLHKKQRPTAHKSSHYKRDKRHLKDTLCNYKRFKWHGKRRNGGQ